MPTYQISIWYAHWSLDEEPQIETGLTVEQADIAAGAFIRGGVRKLVVEVEQHVDRGGVVVLELDVAKRAVKET